MPPPPTPTAITQPTVLNLYPNSPTGAAPLLTVMVTAVGNAGVSMPLAFDTGSAGVTLDAGSIFPPNMVSSSGFVFPAGQTTLTYNGITVTKLQGTRSYGTVNKTVEYGNLGFASLTIGDGAGQVTTQMMPVFLFYSVVTTQGTAYAPPRWEGWFGVASTSGSIEVAGAVQPAGGFAACDAQSTTTCYVVSGLKYLDYASGVDAGFALAPAPIETCDITTAGSCSGQPVLTVGLNAAVESGFSTTALICPPTGYVGPADIAGYPVCQKNIPGVNVKTIGLEFAFQFTGDAFFDTGTPFFYFSTPPNEVFLSQVSPGTSISITTPSGFAYSYVDGSTPAGTEVDLGGDGNSIIGLQYFTTNSYLLNFSQSTTGWR
jgi:hypothetical protein